MKIEISKIQNSDGEILEQHHKIFANPKTKKAETEILKWIKNISGKSLLNPDINTICKITH